jgi:hypothetical protein
MAADDADELVVFQDVRVFGSTPSALLCQIGEKRVWLPRGHITGKLWCTGDRGKLLIRRWVARDRRLIDPPHAADAVPSLALSDPGAGVPRPLHLARGDN